MPILNQHVPTVLIASATLFLTYLSTCLMTLCKRRQRMSRISQYPFWLRTLHTWHPPSAADKELRGRLNNACFTVLREGKGLPLLVARLTVNRLAKKIACTRKECIYLSTNDEDHSLQNHIDRFRYLGSSSTPALLSQILKRLCQT
jgi:hypothetical protein